MGRRAIFILIIILLLVVSLFFYIQISKSNTQFSITFFNIGQGDAALIKFNNGQKMLVDCGPDRKILSKLGNTLPFYDRTIDYLLITHFDLDHYGGCADVLDRYEIKEIIMNSTKKEFDPYWKHWDEKQRQELATVKIMTEPEQWAIGSSTINFLNPDNLLALDAKDSEGNNASIVFKLTNIEKTFMLVGDMEIPLEHALVQKYCSSTLTNCPILKADILKAGHHGSDSSSSDELLRAVSPKQAVISVGKNSFGHPSLRVMKRLERAGIDILSTEEEGDIVIK